LNVMTSVYEADYVGVPEIEETPEERYRSIDEIEKEIKALEKTMREAAKALEFERAAQVRDRIKNLRSKEIRPEVVAQLAFRHRGCCPVGGVGGECARIPPLVTKHQTTGRSGPRCARPPKEVHPCRRPRSSVWRCSPVWLFRQGRGPMRR
jgi:hypothetical protein